MTTRSVAIMRRLSSKAIGASYLARDAGGPVLLLSIDDPAVVDAVEPFFSTLKASGCSVLKDVSLSEQTLQLTFSYPAADALTLEKATRDLTLKQRNQLAGSLMNTVYQLPWPILYDVLDSDKIFATPDGVVSILYQLEVYDGYDRDCRRSAMSRLADILCIVYDSTDYPPIDSFIANLRSAWYVSADELQSAFNHIFTAISSIPEEPEDAPDGDFLKWLTELFEKIKKNAAVLAAAGLLLVGYIALGRAVYDAFVNPAITGDISAIGTVELYDYE